MELTPQEESERLRDLQEREEAELDEREAELDARKWRGATGYLEVERG